MIVFTFSEFRKRYYLFIYIIEHILKNFEFNNSYTEWLKKILKFQFHIRSSIGLLEPAGGTAVSIVTFVN